MNDVLLATIRPEDDKKYIEIFKNITNGPKLSLYEVENLKDSPVIGHDIDFRGYKRALNLGLFKGVIEENAITKSPLSKWVVVRHLNGIKSLSIRLIKGNLEIYEMNFGRDRTVGESPFEEKYFLTEVRSIIRESNNIKTDWVKPNKEFLAKTYRYLDSERKPFYEDLKQN